ncbi:MAG: hypothetical protein F6K23_26835 [Okeania sp. SIO2C9]|uniref:hypothetical protein n=1 Tax=Okeania sp. SIO2C9 TaxID=2607791 RepID=UPI0013BF4557|nr:hypothetical protein [Okeania sp. SIO2C9]NEQ76338.1 hypothetical protein [Okeania sp. SIO2C9]
MNKIFTSFLNLQQPLMKTAFCITVIGLPLSIAIEFSNNSQWLLYFKLYPHLILSFILGAQTELFSKVFGLNTIDERTWIFVVIFSWLLTYLFFNYLGNQNQES